MRVRVCLQKEAEQALCVCLCGGELSIVTGAESGLLLPHLKGNTVDNKKKK